MEKDNKVYEFLALLSQGIPEDERVIFCAFDDDPNTHDIKKWRPRVYTPGKTKFLPFRNNYFCVSSMKPNEKGEYRRRKENFGHGLCLLIDDIGEGIGSKASMEVIERLPPTAIVETSPKNYQAFYFFEKPEADQALFDALIRGFIKENFLDGTDPGMAGVNRVCRLPFGINGKEKYVQIVTETKPDGSTFDIKRHFSVNLVEFNPNNRYSIEHIANVFNISLEIKEQENLIINTLPHNIESRVKNFQRIAGWLKDNGNLKATAPDQSGWLSIVCPWTSFHTGKVDNGAAIKIPSIENDWNGGFRCHHGHCQDKKFKDLSEFIASESTDLIKEINDSIIKKDWYLETLKLG